MESTEPESTSEFADEGTAAHFLLSTCLQGNHLPAEFAGQGIYVGPQGQTEFVKLPSVGTHDSKLVWPVDDEMVEAIGRVIVSVRDRVADFELAGAKSVILLAEQRLPIAEITGEKNAEGTSDVVIIAEFDDHSIVEVDDLKYGKGVVVRAEHNGQLQMYALSVVLKHSALHVFKEVLLRIHQPRIDQKPSEWKLSVDDLLKFGFFAKQQATIALRVLEDGITTALSHLSPGETQCKFCRAKAKCPAAAKEVHDTVFGEFQAIDDPAAEPVTPTTTTGPLAEYEARLPLFMGRVGMIESWCKAIRAKVEENLLAGKKVAGYKLVTGRKGDRMWSFVEGVERFLVASQVNPDAIWKPKELNSPAVIEKKTKGVQVIVDSRPVPIWTELVKMVKQSDGKPSVAPVDDPREVWTPVSTDEFDSFDDGADLV
jgi:hypothetical protein